jgi:alkylated DNA repair dioxygenase AlkB
MRVEKVRIEKKSCSKCGNVLSLDNFYYCKNTGKYHSACKRCVCSIEKKRYAHPKNPEDKRVLSKPGQYFDLEQKEMTFDYLHRLGWNYNEENGIWYKPPLKDSSGNWPGIPDHQKLTDNYKEYQKNYRATHKEKIKGYYLTKKLLALGKP